LAADDVIRASTPTNQAASLFASRSNGATAEFDQQQLGKEQKKTASIGKR